MNQNLISLRPLGKTDILVSPVGLGVMQFTGNKGIFRSYFNEIEQERMNNIVQIALDGGVNWFDTAEMYGRGASERALANALKAADAADDQVIVCTKWNPMFRTAKNLPITIKDRIHFLDGYSIDLYMVHQPLGFSSPEAEMDGMADLVEDGKIRSVGVSNFNPNRMKRAHAALQARGLPLTVNQVQYSLFDRRIETNGILETAKELGITIVAWAPLARGLLSGKFHNDPNILENVPFGRRSMLKRNIEQTRPLVVALSEIALRHDVTPAQVALNWLIHVQGESVVVIPGTSKELHATDAVNTMAFKLSEDEMDQLDQLSKTFR
jgi:aryl-alcohol dehydrogenase-like predicted oxidoreductase